MYIYNYSYAPIIVNHRYNKSLFVLKSLDIVTVASPESIMDLPKSLVKPLLHGGQRGCHSAWETVEVLG